MVPGYVTNGFGDHRLGDAVSILEAMGYRAIAVSLDHSLLDPPNLAGVHRAVSLLQVALGGRALLTTIETGARFHLDPWRKHQPTLLSADAAARGLRFEYLRAAIEVAAGIGAKVVSLWSGAIDSSEADHESVAEEVRMQRLADSLAVLLDHASSRDVRICFEPEPGMLVDTMGKFSALVQALGGDQRLGLTLDVGHWFCLADGDLRDHLRTWRSRLQNVHMEDMRRGEHVHLPFGEGQMDFDFVFGALRESGYVGPVHVELPRQSHDAVETARRSYAFLSRFL